MASMDTYFSVLALFILFRETIEASIICGVLLQFLNRSRPVLKRAVWWGVAAGVGVSIIFGVIFIAVYYTAQNNLFSGHKRDWFKGIISWIAAALITILGFAMLRFLGWEEKWKRRLTAKLAEKVPDAAAVAVAADASAPATKDSTALPDAASTSNSDSATVRSSDEVRPTGHADAPAVSQQPSSALSPMPTLATNSSGSVVPALDGKKSTVAAIAKDGVEAADGAADVEACVVTKDEAAAGDVDNSPPTRKEKMNIFILVFTTVVREGIESVVFLGGLGNVKLSAVPLPAFVGITAGCLVGVFLYYSGRQVKHIKWLIISMAIIIFFMAAGQVVLGVDALMRAGMFGYCSVWFDERPWFMQPMYDWTACCADVDPRGDEPTDVQNRMRFFALMRAIFGYQARGTPLTTISYCCYWGLVFILAAFKHWRGTLFDADYKYTQEQRRLAREAKKRAKEEEAAAAEGGAAVEALEAGEAGQGRKEEGQAAEGDVRLGLKEEGRVQGTGSS